VILAIDDGVFWLSLRDARSESTGTGGKRKTLYPALAEAPE
jgi:hypothetical protein